MCSVFWKKLENLILNTEQGHSAGDSTFGDIIFGCKLISRPTKKLKSDNLSQRERILKNTFLLWKVTNSDCVKMVPFYSMVYTPCSDPLREVECLPMCIFWIISAELKQQKICAPFYSSWQCRVNPAMGEWAGVCSDVWIISQQNCQLSSNCRLKFFLQL